MNTSKITRVLTVGAGPVGLSAAFFLNRIKGVKVDIVQKKPIREEKRLSKALLVNPRTLSIFKGTEICDSIIQNSILMTSMKMHRGYDEVLTVNLAELLKGKTQFPHLAIHPQSDTENVIEKALQKEGVKVQRGLQVQSVKDFGDRVQVTFKNILEKKVYDVVLATDGAHSAVRHCLGVRLQGQTLKQKLYLCDAELEGSELTSVQVFFHQKLFFMMIPMKNNVTRIIGTQPNYLDYLPNKYRLLSKDWESQFVVNNRTIPKMNYGNIYFAGDASHVHAPIGGRGCNLGIQDAFVFSKLLQQGKLSEYHNQRKPRIDGFVNKVKKASSVMICEQNSTLRNWLPRLMKYVFPLTKGQMVKFVSGLDYQLPQLNQRTKL